MNTDLTTFKNIMLKIGRTQKDKFFESPKNIIKFKWETFNPENGLHIKVTGCSNDDLYIAKDDTQGKVIIRPLKCSLMTQTMNGNGNPNDNMKVKIRTIQ